MLKMKQRPRIYYTETDKAMMWDRWQKGDTMHAVALLFDRSHSSVRGILAESNGIRPPQKRRSKLSLTLAEREEISRGVVGGQPQLLLAQLFITQKAWCQAESAKNAGPGFNRYGRWLMLADMARRVVDFQ
jgi:hypothetical protein